MYHRHVELFLHIVWSTWDRVPWIDPTYDREIRRCAHRQIGAAGVLLASGAYDDHVHVLLRASPTIVPATVVGAIKGHTSHELHARFAVDPAMRFSEGYALFSVSPEHVTRLVRYIEDQRVRHAEQRLSTRWELPPAHEEDPALWPR